ncbi:hypothetical protein B566_EDAN017965, partial [Ephemera danica]
MAFTMIDTRPILKKNAVPTRFECQGRLPKVCPKIRTAVEKRKHLDQMNRVVLPEVNAAALTTSSTCSDTSFEPHFMPADYLQPCTQLENQPCTPLENKPYDVEYSGRVLRNQVSEATVNTGQTATPQESGWGREQGRSGADHRRDFFPFNSTPMAPVQQRLPHFQLPTCSSIHVEQSNEPVLDRNTTNSQTETSRKVREAYEVYMRAVAADDRQRAQISTSFQTPRVENEEGSNLNTAAAGAAVLGIQREFPLVTPAQNFYSARQPTTVPGNRDQSQNVMQGSQWQWREAPRPEMANAICPEVAYTVHPEVANATQQGAVYA